VAAAYIRHRTIFTAVVRPFSSPLGHVGAFLVLLLSSSLIIGNIIYFAHNALPIIIILFNLGATAFYYFRFGQARAQKGSLDVFAASKSTNFSI
jgi:hypothetical protein